jgi:putative ABC transport system permease protein
MRKIVKIAIRNLLRNRRRTVITISAIFFGVVAIIVMKGIITGLQEGFARSITEGFYGDIQLHRKGFLEAAQANPLDFILPEVDKVRGLLNKRGLNFSERIRFSGMISTGENTLMFQGLSFYPDKERLVTPALSDFIIKGSYLEEENSILIAEGLSKGLGVGIGDTVMLVAYTIDGVINAQDVVINGIIQINLPFLDKSMVITTLPLAKRLLYMEDEITEIGVDTQDIFEAGEVSVSLNESFRKEGIEVVAHPWDEVAKFFRDIRRIQNGALGVIMLILFAIVAISIINTMTMAVFERIREIGTLRAIGAGRSTVISLFILEALFICLVGAILGCLVGSIVVGYLSKVGISFTPPTAQRAVLIFPAIHMDFLLFTFLFSLAVGIISSIYPAFLASKITPVEAIRYR